MLDSTALISPAPKPVAVRLCLGRVKPGPTGPCNVEIGALVEGFRSLGAEAVAAAMVRFGQEWYENGSNGRSIRIEQKVKTQQGRDKADKGDEERVSGQGNSIGELCQYTQHGIK